jgi:hypothetical protein
MPKTRVRGPTMPSASAAGSRNPRGVLRRRARWSAALALTGFDEHCIAPG